MPIVYLILAAVSYAFIVRMDNGTSGFLEQVNGTAVWISGLTAAAAYNLWRARELLQQLRDACEPMTDTIRMHFGYQWTSVVLLSAVGLVGLFCRPLTIREGVWSIIAAFLCTFIAGLSRGAVREACPLTLLPDYDQSSASRERYGSD